ncbi:MAG: TAXI family TRAP transporter solute-binding subunit [Rhodospirillaceae bacterium]
MSRNRRLFTFATTAAAIAAFFAVDTLKTADAQRQSIRWATSNTGSYGYKVGAAMSTVLEKALGGNYTVTVQPYPSTTGAMKAAMDGDAEVGYTADVGMRSLYDGEAGFKGYTPKKGRLVHAWYAYPMESFMAAPAKTADQFKCWGDFSGKPVFFTTAGFMNWLNFRRIYAALDYNFNHLEIDPSTQSDALTAGTIAGSVAYTTAGRSLASYWRETENRTDFKVINPCPDEVAKLTARGLKPVEVDPKNAFSKDVGVEKIYGVPIYFAYNVRADMSADVVYRMVSAFYDARADLAKQDAGFTPMAADFVGMQVGGIGANPDIPVHAGLARFLKENNAWNDSWKTAGE